MDKIRLLNSKSADFDWYYSGHNQKTEISYLQPTIHAFYKKKPGLLMARSHCNSNDILISVPLPSQWVHKPFDDNCRCHCQGYHVKFHFST